MALGGQSVRGATLSAALRFWEPLSARLRARRVFRRPLGFRRKFESARAGVAQQVCRLPSVANFPCRKFRFGGRKVAAVWRVLP